jgi:hypothetical protein
MTSKEISDQTGIALSTVLKYAGILEITHYGTGKRKVYDWKKSDIKKKKKSIGKRGRPPKENK